MVGVHHYGIWLLSAIIVATCEENPLCSSLAPRSIHFTIRSSRNHTGHWNALIVLNHQSNPKGSDQLETGSWEVDVKQSVQKCKEREVIRTEALVTAPPVRPGPGYEFVPGMGYYKLHTTLKNWLEARQICSDEGAHLAIVNSDKEMNVLQRIFVMHPTITEGWQNDAAFLGIHDMYVEGQYITIFGEPLENIGYSKISPSDTNGTENCGCTLRTNGIYDVGCGAHLPFFCEQEMQ